MLTLFATPKAFQAHTGLIQRNAILSWASLRPGPEIVLFGDEPGVAEICREVGLRHVPDVAWTVFGVPLLSDVFQKAQRLGRHELLCYVNADIILLSDFVQVASRARAASRKFLMVGRRWDVRVGRPLDFTRPETEQDLRTLVLRSGRQGPLPGNSDYFLFSRGLWAEIPPLAIGRGWWDAWLVYEARRLGADVFDASTALLAIHQMHDQTTHRGDLRRWRREINRNRGIAGEEAGRFCLYDATHLLTPEGVRRPIGLHYLSRWLDTLPVFHPSVAVLLQVPRAGIALVRAIRKRAEWARDPNLRLSRLVISRVPEDGIVSILGLRDGRSESARWSTGVRLAHSLLWGGVPVAVFDPDPGAMEEARRVLGGPVEFAASADDCAVRGAMPLLRRKCTS